MSRIRSNILGFENEMRNPQAGVVGQDGTVSVATEQLSPSEVVGLRPDGGFAPAPAEADALLKDLDRLPGLGHTGMAPKKKAEKKKDARKKYHR